VVEDENSIAPRIGLSNKTKRQNTWFKKNKKIRWITTEKQAETLMEYFLSESGSRRNYNLL